jgi:hypothetical protein
LVALNLVTVTEGSFAGLKLLPSAAATIAIVGALATTYLLIVYTTDLLRDVTVSRHRRISALYLVDRVRDQAEQIYEARVAGLPAMDRGELPEDLRELLSSMRESAARSKGTKENLLQLAISQTQTIDRMRTATEVAFPSLFASFAIVEGLFRVV